MSLVSIKDLSCTHSIKVLFEDATFSIEDTDKVAVIGPNGCGKSTLLSLLSTLTNTPDLRIATQKGLTIAYLPQKLLFNPNHTIQEHLFQSKAPAVQALVHYQRCLNDYEIHQNIDTETALSNASSEMDHSGAWDYEDRVNSIFMLLSEMLGDEIFEEKIKTDEIIRVLSKVQALIFTEELGFFEVVKPINSSILDSKIQGRL